MSGSDQGGREEGEGVAREVQAKLEAFLVEHGLDPALRGPLEEVVRLSARPEPDPWSFPEAEDATAILRREDLPPDTTLGGRHRLHDPTSTGPGDRGSAPHTTSRTPSSQLPTILQSREIQTVLKAPSLDAAPATIAMPGLDDEHVPVQSAATGPSSEPELLGLLGRGGMGEVHRARDGSLNRILAIKILGEHFADDGAMRARFLAEAQVTAQLAHPGIPPVHSVGQLDDGRPFFTMKEVHGRTLSDIIDLVRAGTARDQGWTESRLLDVLIKVCDATAYAHARGVVHCDLKPANVMVGAFGEVLVMDWGVARLVAPSSSTDTNEPRVALTWFARPTSESTVAGTPAYMSPEQGNADGVRIGPPADVYALGVMLYEVLSGRRPYNGDAFHILWKAGQGQIPKMVLPAHTTVDETLEGIVRKAMGPEPEDRYPDAAALAADLTRWREGSLRREKARAVVRQAQALLPESAASRRQAEELRDRADQMLNALSVDASAEEKRPAWQLEDDAAGLERRASLAMVESIQQLHGALAHAPELAEAHELLARIHHDRHREAERARDWDEAARQEVLLRAHDTGVFSRYLAGVSALTVLTDPPCRVRLHRYVSRGRMLVPEHVRDFASTPLVDVELPVGSYLLELDAGDRPVVRYPVLLRRSQPWSGCRPGERSPWPVPLPREGEVGAHEVYVPGGWALLGGDLAAPGALPWASTWVDGFVIGRDAVDSRHLYRFLADGSAESVLARRQVLRSGVSVNRPDWPACGVSFDVARAAVAWRAAAEGRPWRLPSEAEWEKAGRGVDGRWFPWGDRIDPSFAHVRPEASTPRAPRALQAVPQDRSPYGVHGLAGNVRDWCLDPFAVDPFAVAVATSIVPGGIATLPDDEVQELRSVRGGSWRLPPESARVAARAGLPRGQGHPDVAFRLTRSWPDPTDAGAWAHASPARP